MRRFLGSSWRTPVHCERSSTASVDIGSTTQLRNKTSAPPMCAVYDVCWLRCYCLIAVDLLYGLSVCSCAECAVSRL